LKITADLLLLFLGCEFDLLCAVLCLLGGVFNDLAGFLTGSGQQRARRVVEVRHRSTTTQRKADDESNKNIFHGTSFILYVWRLTPNPSSTSRAGACDSGGSRRAV